MICPRAGFCALFFAASLSRAALAQPVVINEIHYDPLENTIPEEFVELFNPAATTVDVSGWFFTGAMYYRLPAGTEIGPGEYLVVAQDPQTLTDLYGQLPVVGPFDGRLDNDGEEVVLRDGQGDIVDQVDYGAGFPWPLASAGEGRSMELIHPSLDNDLGGSWRASGGLSTGNPVRQDLIAAQSSGWRYRKGTSNPAAGWRRADFVEDGSWLPGRTSVGYGDGDDNTVLGDMQNNYTSVYLRREFTIASEETIPSRLMIAVYVDDGAIVALNDHEVARLHVSAGDKDFDDLADSHEASWEEVIVPASLLEVGTNVLAIHALNTTRGSSDFSIDATLFIPADGEGAGVPSPGARNSVFSATAPPQIRQVRTMLSQPQTGQFNHVSARVTDPDGVEAVELHYQVVLPGEYIPAFFPVPLAQLLADANTPRPPNPAFEDPANWTTIPMVDDGMGTDLEAGDDVYSALVPGQVNRSLVRYRITVRDTLGASVRVPYADDPSLNFAYFVYNGVPEYRVTTSIRGAPAVYPAADITSMSVYILITRNRDVLECVAANSAQQIPQGNQARFAENWEGTFVHNGVVYDHITYRLRGANGRYQIPPSNPGDVAGKRHWRFKFNKGHHLQAHDRFGMPYPTKWRVLNTGRMFGNRLDGNWGLGDQVNDIIWNAYGVPAAFGHAFHFRVVDGVAEAPGGSQGQYLGDFWGIARAFENYDVRFLEAHGLAKGNLYKLVNQTRDAKEQQRYQAPEAVWDGSDHDNIENSLRPTQSSAWLDAHVNYEEWYRYHAVAQALRHYDYWPSANKNAAWYFEPVYTAANGFRGWMWTLPFDADATWGPTWNEGQDRPYDAIYGGSGKPEFQKAYRNHIREVRDLLWQRDQLELVIRQTAAFMWPLQDADTDRWRNAPPEAGRQFFSASTQRTLEGKAQDMLRFAFTGGSWPGGSVGAGGRAAFLDSLADGPDAGRLPTRPTVTYTGPGGFPIDALTFRASGFSDPQGSGTFQAMEWRLAEVSIFPNAGSLSLSDPSWRFEPVRLELEATWKSRELTVFDPHMQVPAAVVVPGHRYRVRVRMEDTSNRRSHWSPPVEFTAAEPTATLPQQDFLRVSEIMYHPLGDSGFEFVELQNVGPLTLNLEGVAFTEGIEFSFADSLVTELLPGDYVVVVNDLAVFEARYDTSQMLIAGEYGGRLSNTGEPIALSYGGGLAIQQFTYDDLWYPATDGFGSSLEIRDPHGAVSDWNTSTAWQASAVPHGTPGLPPSGEPPQGGRQRPGDSNQDLVIDISDVVSLLRHLFLGAAAGLPCEGETADEGGNRILLDINGDEGVDVSDAVHLLDHLFRHGPPPFRGVGCILIEGCPNRCGS